MNNCPKCGNPLQVGVANCPICGTNIENPGMPVAPEVKKENVGVSQTVNQAPLNNGVQAVAAQPTPSPTPAVQSAPTVAQPKEVAPVSVQTATTPEAAPASVSPAPQVAPSQVSVTPVANQAPQAQVAPSPTAAVQMTPVDQNKGVAPTVVPASINPGMPVTPSVQTPLVTDPPKKSNILKNKKALFALGGVAVFAIIAVVGFMLLNGGNKNLTPQTNNTPSETLSVVSNGYKFNIEKTWSVNEDGNNVVITNDGETVFIKLAYSNSNISDINKTIIEQYLKQYPEYTDSSVNETKISAKDAYLVNSKINNMPIQIYFINGGSNLLLGITIIYQTDDTKAKYEASVTELVGSIYYADDSLKALSTINMYSNIFGLYNGIINYKETPNNQQQGNNEEQVNQNPSESENVQNPENPENSETNNGSETPVANQEGEATTNQNEQNISAQN